MNSSNKIALSKKQNKRIIEYSKSRDWRGMLAYADDNFATFSDVNWSTMFSRLGRMTRDAPAIRSDQVFRRLVQDKFEARVEREGLEWMGVRELANAIHGLVALGVRRRSLIYDMAGESGAERIVMKGDPQHISMIAVSFARLGFRAPRFFDCLERRAIAKKIV